MPKTKEHVIHKKLFKETKSPVVKVVSFAFHTSTSKFQVLFINKYHLIKALPIGNPGKILLIQFIVSISLGSVYQLRTISKINTNVCKNDTIFDFKFNGSHVI